MSEKELLIRNVNHSIPLAQKPKQLEDEVEQLSEEIEQKKIQKQILTKDQIEFWLKNMERLNLASDVNRQRIINTFVNSIYVHDDKCVVNFYCREESETIPLDNKGNVSYLDIVGEPYTVNGEPQIGLPLFVFYLGKPVFELVVPILN